MKIYIMRHGEAEPPVMRPYPGADAKRVLTDCGHAEAETAAEWLKTQEKGIDLAIVSPYSRARQTYDHVADSFPIEVTEVSTEVTPDGDPDDFASALLARLQIEPAESVLIVSHMPFVCYLVNYLDCAVQAPLFPTAGVAVLDVEPLAMSGALKQFYKNSED